MVFVTAYDEFAVAAFEQQALDYVLKPVKAERLAKTVARLKQAFEAGAAPIDARMAAHCSSCSRRPPAGAAPLNACQPGRADAADRRRRRAHLPCRRQVHLRARYCGRAADPNAERFAQVHRSTIVNLDHLASTRRDEASRLFVRLRGHAAELPVSQAYVHLFKAM